MADFDDFDLRGTRGPVGPDPGTPASAGPPPWPAIAAAVVIVALLGGGYLVYRNRKPPATQPAVAQTTVNVPRRPAEAGDVIELPPLDESDAVVRALVTRLSSHPIAAAWLTTDRLLRNLTVVIVNVADGDTPAKHLRPVRPSGKFAVRESNGVTWIDPAAYRRYDGIGEAVEGLDARGVARFYATVKPRLADAYRDLGGPDADVDRTLERAIVMLLRTPIVDHDVQVRANANKVSYEYADEGLEGLSKAQRQFMRMGPQNVRRVQAKVREVAGYLGIPDSALPPPR
jgi:Protein of unknown function (DUF3014)